MKVAATLTVNGIAYPVELEPGTSLLDGRPRRRRADRLEGGLRRLRVRGLHDAARREAGEQLLVPRPAGGGQRGDDRRGPRDRRRAEPAPGGVPRARRRAVRLLHARDADLGDGAPGREPRRRAPTRCGSRCPATSAAAPATTASSRPCSPSPARPGPAEPSGRSRRRERALDAVDDLRRRARPRSATVVRRRSTSSAVCAHSSVTANDACAAMSGPSGWSRSSSDGSSAARSTTFAARLP